MGYGRFYNALHGFCVSAFVRSLSPLLSHTKRYCFAFLYQSVFYVNADVTAVGNVMVSTEDFLQRLRRNGKGDSSLIRKIQQNHYKIGRQVNVRTEFHIYIGCFIIIAEIDTEHQKMEGTICSETLCLRLFPCI